MLSVLSMFDNFPHLGDVIFHNEVNVSHLHIHGTFNGVDTDQRMTDSVRIGDANVQIQGKKIFHANLTVFKKRIDLFTINSLPLADFMEHVVLRNVPANFTEKITVNGHITTPTITAEALIVKVRFSTVTA